jgi:hypothetical protein
VKLAEGLAKLRVLTPPPPITSLAGAKASPRKGLKDLVTR